MKIYKTLEQGSDEWLELRKLKLTASNATAIGNAGKGLITHVNELVLKSFIAEQERYVSADMERGNTLEPLARTKYEMVTGSEVEEIGFVERCKYSGCSPDGFVDKDGLLEIKARNDLKHFMLLQGGPNESATEWQIQMQLLVCQKKWCDFVSYNPNFKKSIFIKRYQPDPTAFEKLEKGIEMGKKMIQELLSTETVKYETAKDKSNR
jgi:hypothetical protein